MAKRKKTKRSKKPQKAPPQKAALPTESPAAEVTTVAWLLTTLATLCAGFLGATVAALAPADAAAQSLWRAFPFLAFFSALVTGVVGLALGATAVRVRNAAPPRGVTMGAAVICLAPWVVLLILQWMA